MSTFTGGQPQLLRVINERRVLELIRLRGPTSRAEIARASGLSKPTVSLALSALTAAGLVHQTGRSSGHKGPRAQLYELNPGSGWVVGIDVGRQRVRAAVADITGDVVATGDEAAQAESAETLVAQIGRLAHRVAGEAGTDWTRVTHATIASPGVLDPRRELVEHAPELPGWGRQGLVGAVRDELGTAVSFENDVNMAALAEREHGLGRDVSTFVFLWVGTGIGLGIVIGGELYRGAGGAAGEIAYLPVGVGDPHDAHYRRRGQLEEAAGSDAVVRRAHELGLAVTSTEEVFAGARGGDARAREIVAAEARHIALAIAVVVPVLNPELVILGGSIAGNGDLLLRPIEQELAEMSPFRPRLAVSDLGEGAVLDGAVAVALEAAQARLFDRARELDRKEVTA
jgi:predicted NBD/HSP70 family sugar kinase